MSEEVTGVMQVARMPGIANIVPVKARGRFAQAWFEEYQAGETTERAEALLEEAVQIIEETARKLAGQ